MAVYVDKMFPTKPYQQTCKNARFYWPEACHMWADEIDELHVMADSIGLKRSWFQHHPRHPHYDITASKRAMAIARGAIQRSLRHYIAKQRGLNVPATPGVCCDCGYEGREETPCTKREDGTHCEHWWDGDGDGK